MIDAPSAPLGTADTEPPERTAAKGLESFFLRQLLAEARASSPGLLDGGFAGDTFRSMLDDALADAMSGAGLGLADTFETALDTVDRRSTPAGATPVIATTLESLKAQTATVGQTGFVTSDGDNTGPYLWDGTSWHHAHWYTADDKAKTTLVNKSGWKCEYMMKHGFVYVTVNLSDIGTKG